MVFKVLLIDNDKKLLALLKTGLEREGFAVITAENGRDGLRQAYQAHPDAIVLDAVMPDLDGWTICQRLRQVCDVPIIVLSGKSGHQAVVKALSLGADDYLTKPCNLKELKTRIYARIRRRTVQAAPTWLSVYDDGNLNVDLRHGMVTRRGEIVDLSPTEMRLLAYLLRRQGHIVSHEELLARVWGFEYKKGTRLLGVYISYLRQKIEDNPSNPHYIRTLWGQGYLFAGRSGEERVSKAVGA